ncbi:MAG TPA: FliH/SctL family protein [Solirubrobacteraceae bacterium]|nr:FliH/SctL family protein [Solirubrobacteraceae bacterium]
MSSIVTYEFAALEGSNPRHAEDVLSAAWAEAEQVRAQARAEGFAAGRAAGLADFQARADTALRAFAAATQRYDAATARTVEVLEVQAAELALALTQHILAGALAVEPERIVDVCRGALRRLVDRQRVTVTVHPDDLETVSGQIAGITAELGGIERFEVQADRRIDPGGVTVRTDHGEIDATVATQLAAAREIVMAALEGGRGEPPADTAAGERSGARDPDRAAGADDLTEWASDLDGPDPDGDGPDRPDGDGPDGPDRPGPGPGPDGFGLDGVLVP